MNINPNQITVLALKVTSTPPRDRHDYQLRDWAVSGLLRPSTVRTAKMAEIRIQDIDRRLGALTQEEFAIIISMLDSF